MAKLQINLLGEVAILKDGQPIKGLPSRAAEALLIYLICNPKAVAREKLAELLWAERTSSQSLTNLRTILTPLRRTLGEYLRVERDTLAFHPNSDFSLDSFEFETRLKELGLPDRLPLLSDPSTILHLRRALDLYRGDFLEGFHLRDGVEFEEWSMLLREHFQQLAQSGFRALALACLEQGCYVEGLDATLRWARLDPYNEDACRTQMWLHVRLGQRSAALQCYQTLKQKLIQDFNVLPASATTELYQRLRELELPPPVHLPSFPTDFIGRETDLDKLTSWLLISPARLITVTGIGGIGKTRLAVETARRIAQTLPGRFLHGIFFIPLETLERAEEIPIRMAEAMGFSLDGVDPPIHQILEHLQERECLLVMDNFEHLLDKARTNISFIIELLRQAPNIKIILTSRECLNLYEEVVFEVRGLDTREDEAPAEGSDAMWLFVQCARRGRQEVFATDEEQRHAAAICRMVEGVPLAIELASAWTRHYTCAQIVAMLNNDLDFLTSPLVDMPEKHRSLRAVFDRSWALLLPAEQAAFAQLTVFHGGFTREAAQAVIGDAVSLSDLADKSLIQQQSGERFAIHPLLQQYAAEKIATWPEGRNIAVNRHTQFFLDFLARLGEGESPPKRAAIRPERDNVRVACERAVQAGMTQALEKIVGILHSFFSAESWFLEGIALFQALLDTIVERQPGGADGLKCELLARMARMRTQIGQMELARADLNRALGYLENLADSMQRSRVLDSLAITNYYAGDYPQATVLAKESLSLSEQANDANGVAFSLNFLGSCAKAQGDYVACRAYFEKAVATYRAMNDEIGVGMVLNNLGNLLQAQNDFAGAQKFYVEASERLKAQNHLHGAATTLVNAGKLALRQNQNETARRFLEEGLEMKRKINDQRGEVIALAALGDAALAAGDIDEAAVRLRAALELASSTNAAQLMLDVLVVVAALAVRQRRQDFARRILSYITRHSGTVDETRQQAAQMLKECGDEPQDDAWSHEWVEDVVAAVLQAL